jgi:hypothetical protein
MRERQEKVASLMREFQRAAACWGKRSKPLREKRQFVTALLAKIESTLGRSFSSALVAQCQAPLHEFYLANRGEEGAE